MPSIHEDMKRVGSLILVLALGALSISAERCAAAADPPKASGNAATIPHPAALDAAAVCVPRLDSVLEYALIVGNGDLNALVYQEKDKLILRITKNDVWDARLLTADDPPLPTLARLKELGRAARWPGKYGRRQILPKGVKYTGEDSYHKYSFPCPLVCGVVEIDLPRGVAKGAGDEAVNRRVSARLDLRRARADVFLGPWDKPVASIRILAQSNAILIQTRHAARLRPVPNRDLPAPKTGAEDETAWVDQKVPGDLDWLGMEFAVAMDQAENRKAVAVVTSREAKDARAAAVELAEGTTAAPPEALIKPHEAVWQEFWTASGIAIDDPLLQNTWYRSLYFLRCVSKPGAICPGLFAGLVGDKAAWHGDYHADYNIQQTFGGCLAANHVDLLEPYQRLINEYLPRAEWIAKQIFDCRGAHYHVTMYPYEPSHPEKCRSLKGRQYVHHVWGMMVGLGSFAVQPLWWSYQYQPDRQRLENVVYPPLRAVALFALDFMDTCDKDSSGKVILAPSVSPEHWGWTAAFKRNRNSVFDIAMFRFTFGALIEASEILGRDEDLAERCRRALALLPEFPVNKNKRGQTIVVDVEDATPLVYNLAVPAVPVFPGSVVTFRSPPEQIELFQRTIDGLQWNGNNSLVILAIARARLSMPRSAEWFRNEVNQRLRPNGTLRLNPKKDYAFNDFGHFTEQFAATMCVSELLLQSAGDVIRVFPAWPKNKPAQFADLRAQGGFLVTSALDQGRVTRLEIRSTVGGLCRVLNPWPGQTVECRAAGRTQTLKPDAQRILTIATQAGDVLLLRPAP